ncbi:MAG TPA: twin-arginine translocase subunit TatC [Nitrososphaeraceae archaeon]|jgi:sec-independent protein translocase protein TatC|nr:twin-arginine translocase subunit TatC [Nitrososphaeraceae archaeon]
MYKERSFIDYLQEIRIRIIRIVLAVVLVTILCTTLTINVFDFNGYKIPFPYPDPSNNIAIQVIITMKENLLPENVTLIQVAPGQAFFAQIYVAVILGIIMTMPFIVREFVAFIGPGLYQHEKATVKKVTIYAIGLFAIGSLFSYFIVVPYILEFLYIYGESIGISTFFEITEFIPFVMHLLIAFGLSYQLPIIMWASTVSEMVEPRFWRNNLRYFIIIIAIFSAIITPDGSGVTMWFIAGPMLLLYVLGILLIERKIKRVSPKLA